MKKEKKDIILVGAGIMSTTIAVLLKKLNPNFNIKMYEMLDKISEESSGAMNNAGTGHSGFCELNYTPQKDDGSVDISKAVSVAREFMLSKEFWSYLVEEGYIKDPSNFIRTTYHYSFVNNESNINFLKTRYNELIKHPVFKDMEYSEDHDEIRSWLPLVMNERSKDSKVAATRMKSGTDVDFEALTKEIVKSLVDKGEIELFCSHIIKDLRQQADQKWKVKVEDLKNKKQSTTFADFVFIGAGGGSILLLEKSGIPESKLFGGFPVGGEWLVCEKEEVINKHAAKVYGQAKIGAPPMSVPHLDTRIIDGKKKLLFGPFATFSTKFLKNGSHLDLFKSLQINNVVFMTQAGLRNIDLTKYLIDQVRLTKKDKIEELKEYLPSAKEEDWVEQAAGQRVQVIKKDKDQGGILEFGTQVVNSQDGTIAALLGASPGASTSVYIMLKVIEQCFSDDFKSNDWQTKNKSFVPSANLDFNDDIVVKQSQDRTNNILKL